MLSKTPPFACKRIAPVLFPVEVIEAVDNASISKIPASISRIERTSAFALM